MEKYNSLRATHFGYILIHIIGTVVCLRGGLGIRATAVILIHVADDISTSFDGSIRHNGLFGFGLRRNEIHVVLRQQRQRSAKSDKENN